MMCAPAGSTMSESFVVDATPAPAAAPTIPPMTVPLLFPPITRPRIAPAAAPAPTFAAAPDVTPRPLWIVSSESTLASIGYVLPPTVTLVTASVKVPGVRGLGAGFTSVILPFTTAPAGITTCPAAFLTASTTCALNASPVLDVREDRVSFAARSSFAPALRVRVAGRAGAGGGAGGRAAGGRTAGGAAGGLAGTSRMAVVDSVGASVRSRAVESLVWAWSCFWQALKPQAAI